MRINFYRTKFFLALLCLPLVTIFIPSPIYAATPWGNNCVQFGDVATLQGLECAFSNFVSVILSFAAIVLFVMFLIGGFRYLTSGGDPKAIESAKGTLTHAIAGLVILLLAYLILIIIEKITNVPVTNFQVTQ